MFKNILFNLGLKQNAPDCIINLSVKMTDKCLPWARKLQREMGGKLVWSVKVGQTNGKISDHFMVEVEGKLIDAGGAYDEISTTDIGDIINICGGEDYIIVAKVDNYVDFGINSISDLIEKDLKWIDSMKD